MTDHAEYTKDEYLRRLCGERPDVVSPPTITSEDPEELFTDIIADAAFHGQECPYPEWKLEYGALLGQKPPICTCIRARLMRYLLVKGWEKRQEMSFQEMAHEIVRPSHWWASSIRTIRDSILKGLGKVRGSTSW